MRLIAVGSLFVLALGSFVKGTFVFSHSPVDITLVAALGVLASVLVQVGRPGHRYSNAAVITIATLVTALTIGLLRAPLNYYADSKRFDVLVVVPVCLIGGMMILDSRTARRLWLAGSLVYGPVVIGLALLDPSPYAYGRLWPDGSSTIAVGRAAGATLVIAWCLILARRKRWLMAAMCPVLVGGLVLSESRGPMAAALVAMAVVSLLRVNQASRGGLVGIAGVMVVALTALAVKPERFTSITDASASIRFKLWELTLSLTASNPVVGIGWGNLYEHQDPDEVLATGAVQYPHNVLLEIGSEVGLIGLLVLLFALAFAFRAQWKAAKSDVVELGMLGLFVFFFVNALASGDIGSNRELWVALGCAWGARRITGTENRTAQRSLTESREAQRV